MRRSIACELTISIALLLLLQFHTPRNLLLALVGEVGEVSELFQWRGECKPGLEGALLTPALAPGWGTSGERKCLGRRQGGAQRESHPSRRARKRRTATRSVANAHDRNIAHDSGVVRTLSFSRTGDFLIGTRRLWRLQTGARRTGRISGRSSRTCAGRAVPFPGPARCCAMLESDVAPFQASA